MATNNDFEFMHADYCREVRWQLCEDDSGISILNAYAKLTLTMHDCDCAEPLRTWDTTEGIVAGIGGIEILPEELFTDLIVSGSIESPELSTLEATDLGNLVAVGDLIALNSVNYNVTGILSENIVSVYPPLPDELGGEIDGFSYGRYNVEVPLVVLEEVGVCNLTFQIYYETLEGKRGYFAGWTLERIHDR